MKVVFLQKENSKPFSYSNLITLEQADFIIDSGYYLEINGNTVYLNKEED